MTKTNRPADLATLRAAAEVCGNDYVLKALDFAENNAHETVFVDRAATEGDLERLTLDSIACTSPFERPEVQAWFLAQGYRW